MTLTCIFQTYIEPLIPLIAALVVYLLGRRAYFRQKEYELITSRYLAEGIDAISKNVDRSLAVFRHNWWQSTVVLKHFRDLGKDMRPELYKNVFLPPDPSHFEIWRDYRLKDVVGDDIFNRAHQSLDAFVKSGYAFFQDDLCSMVRVTVEGGKSLELKATPEKMIEGYLEEVEKLDAAALRYYVLLGELQKISSIVQTERFSFKMLKKLRERREVQESVNALKEHFSDTFESIETMSNVAA